MSIFYLILSLYLLTTGCVPLIAGAAAGTAIANKNSISEVTATNRKNLSFLSVGLSENGAKGMMGTTPFHAYRTEISGNRNITREITISNPYDSEVRQGRGRLLEVIYYVIDDKNNDGEFVDDDLTPLVFDQGKLIGWGWGFLKGSTAK